MIIHIHLSYFLISQFGIEKVKMKPFRHLGGRRAVERSTPDVDNFVKMLVFQRKCSL